MFRALLFFLLIAGASKAASERQNPFANQEKAKQAGAKLFKRHCASCHGPDAAGGDRAPALAAGSIRHAPDEALFQVLRNGSLRRGMPSFSHLPEQQRWQIVTYLKSL